jgi:[ribosomal protein S5]-alanine N-acetyltransferase
MQIETAHLLLRDVEQYDLFALHELDADPEVVRYVSYGPWTQEESQWDLAFHIEEQKTSPRTSYYLAVSLLEEGSPIGWCALDITSHKHREAELGYALNPRHWGCGYSTEAAQALLAFGWEQLGLHRIFATCHPENRASERVLQKIGMKKEGHLREHKWSKGTWRDSLLYAIIERD